jgi:hypothetical protein
MQSRKPQLPEMKGRIPQAAAIERLFASVGSRSFQSVITKPELGDEADEADEQASSLIPHLSSLLLRFALAP